MSKRRRTSSIASRDHEDDSFDSMEASTSSGPTMRKRRKVFDPVELCHQLYDIIRNHKKDDGSLLCDSFIRVPKRRQEPGYYDVVNNPIDLLKVQQKLKMDDYLEVDDLQSDIELIVTNTKAFYKRSTQEYKDANELWDLFISSKNKLLNTEDPKKVVNDKPVSRIPKRNVTKSETRNNVNHNSEIKNTPRVETKNTSRMEVKNTPKVEIKNTTKFDIKNTPKVEIKNSPKVEIKNTPKAETKNTSKADIKSSPKVEEEENEFEELFNAVISAKDDNGKLLYTHFQLLPSKKKYPEYYEVIEQPIDMKMVAVKIQNNKYTYLVEMERDLLLMCKNACLFNEPGSQIYKQAKALRKFIQNRRLEMDAPKTPLPKNIPIKNNGSSNKERGRGLRCRNVTTTAALKDDESEPEPEEEEETHCNDVDLNDPKWKLFEAVRTETGSNGVALSEPFWKLPSRRFYPDYYKEIKNPMSLSQIRNKLIKRGYGNLSEVAGDLTVMFENAKKYNITTSKLYRDAVKLQKLMQTKVHELLDIDQSFLQLEIEQPVRKKPGPKPKNHLSPAPRGRPPKDSIPLKKRLHTLAKYMLDYVTEDGRKPMLAFMEKPSKKLYPDYYDVIAEPIDFLEIEAKIKAEQYSCENDLVKDFKLMFSNCREFNEENSPIYEDANLLEKYLLDRVAKNSVSQNSSRNSLSNSRLSSASRSLTASPRDLTNTPKGILGNHIGTPVIHKNPVGRPPGSGRPKGLVGRPPKNSVGRPKGSVGRPKGSVGRPKGSVGRPPNSLNSRNLLGVSRNLLGTSKSLSGSKAILGASRLLTANHSQLLASHKHLLGKIRKLEKLGLARNLLGNSKSLLGGSKHLGNSKHFLAPDRIKKEKSGVLKACKPGKPPKPFTPLEKCLRSLYDTIRDYREPKENRQLSLIFMKLPSKTDYPDYYEVIKNPIGMERISHKLRTNTYNSLDELVSDFVLMFDNACKYNEPDSQIYKDALVLQRVCLQTKTQLKEDDNIPDVPGAVQDIFLNLFTNVYNYQDDDGRCYSDSMAELPEHDDIDGKKVRAVSLDLIKRRLDKGVYKRLDIFQEDFFSCMDRARRLSRTTSQIFEDTVELQMYFIHQRDELCRNGELLSSPALSYTMEEAKNSIEQLRQSKVLKESLEDETETRSSEDSLLKDNAANETGGSEDSLLKDSSVNDSQVSEDSPSKQSDVNIEDKVKLEGESMTCNQRTFHLGEYVYLDPKEKGCEPHIVCIERMWESKGKKMLCGNYYLRPAETYHLTTKKFLEREVFKSDSHVTVPLDEVREPCCVVNVKQYYTMRPEGYDDKDVYVCESRYSTRHRAFKKIKIYPETPTIKLVPREVPLEQKRVMSIFKERVEKHKGELAELEEQEKLVEKEKPNVVAFINMDIDDGNTYYEQFNTICSGVVKTGDFVYVVVEGGKQIIAQIDSIWETKDNKCYFRGPWYIPPSEVPNSANKLFYKQEVFLSSLEDSNPIVSIIGRCAVLHYNDYITLRPTEIPESDVFICTSMYDEINRQVKLLPAEGLKKYVHNPGVTPDEIYYFTKFLNPSKVVLEVKSELPKRNNNSEKANKNKVVTGYILYSREVRKQVVQNNPESTFGDISRIVGSEWKSLPSTEKQIWEEKASKLNEETKALFLLEEQSSTPTVQAPPPPPPPDQIFECLWDNCDYQFEEVADLIEHCIKDSKESQGHVQAYFQENQGADIICQWRNCSRVKKNLQPFPNIARLIRHVRDMHINKGNGRSVPPENRSRNFKPSSKPQAVNRPTPSATPNPPPVSTNVLSANVQKPPEPMFISVPPRPQRVLHSEAYIKYIEGLQAESRHISPWERTLTASQENTPAPDLEKLQQVATWLGNKADQHDNVVAALWALRNQLLRDTLGLHKTL